MSTKLIDIIKQLKAFLPSSSSSILLKESNGISWTSIIEAQIEKRRIALDASGIIRLHECTDNDFNCLNIIHVAVAERNRRKGLFSDFLVLMEGFEYGAHLEACQEITVRIDKVMNPVLDECLPKKGYARIRSAHDAHYSYQKLVWRRAGTADPTIRDCGDNADRPAAPATFATETIHIAR